MNKVGTADQLISDHAVRGLFAGGLNVRNGPSS
jgi:hypothetical protein